MTTAIFMAEYITWHYGKALWELAGLAQNFMRFGYEVFSMQLLARTWAAPFYRIQEGYTDWTNLESLGETFVGNAVSRIVGFLLRTFMITLGIIFEIFVAVALLTAFAVWVLMPIALPFFIFQGIYLMF